MAELTVLEEKLGEVLGLAMAAQAGQMVPRREPRAHIARASLGRAAHRARDNHDRKELMAKAKRDKKLYRRMREGGLRKSVARQLSELPAQVRGGKRAPKGMRGAVARLETTVSELRGHATRGDRSASARKAAKTRRAKARSRSASARKGARRRSKA